MSQQSNAFCSCTGLPAANAQHAFDQAIFYSHHP